MKRISQLDGVRGFALLMVVFFHYVLQQLHPAPETVGADVLRLCLWTYSAVDLFFVLSGFLITGILLDNAGAENYFKVFYLRRACRILPLYLVAVLSFVVARHFIGGAARFHWLFHDPLPTWCYFTFTQNFVMAAAGTGGPAWIDVTWSVAVEEHFYLVLPLLVFIVPRRSLPWIFGVMILTAPLLRRFVPLGELNTYVSSPWRADALLCGSLLAWCVRQPVILEHIRANVRKLYLVLLVLLPWFFLIAWHGPSLHRTFEHTLFAVFYSALILLVYIDEGSPITRFMRWRPIAWCGTVSYGVYLFHEPISGLLHGLLRNVGPGMFGIRDVAITLSALALSFAVGAASYYLFERRIIKFGHSFRYTTEKPLPAAYPNAPLQPAAVPLAAER